MSIDQEPVIMDTMDNADQNYDQQEKIQIENVKEEVNEE